MSTLEERVTNLEETQHDFVPAFKMMMVVLDQHTIQFGELKDMLVRLVSNQERELFEIKKRMAVFELRANNMDENYDDLRKDVASMKGEMSSMKEDMSLVKNEVSSINNKLDQLLALMRPMKE